MEPVSTKYPAARSLGWLWLGLAGVLLFVFAGLMLMAVVGSGSGIGAVAVIPAAILVILGVCVMLLAGWSSTVRYELSPERLSMFCGPVKYNVAVPEIVSVNKTGLRMTMHSSTRFPGFALGKIPYAGTGDVIMCATRSLRGIILIETGKRKYGVTPSDEAAFLAQLRGYVEER
ncbi:MAG: PH domain-containing protein [Bacillota bacterium]